MSIEEQEMAELLAKTHRDERLSAIMTYVNPDVSAILDLGCGIGALTTRLAERFPSTLIVGVDRSKYLLSRLPRKMNIVTMLGDIPAIPMKNHSFDLVVAVQVLHEIFHFKGTKALIRTFQNVFHLLRKDVNLSSWTILIQVILQFPLNFLENCWRNCVNFSRSSNLAGSLMMIQVEGGSKLVCAISMILLRRSGP